MPPGRRAFIVTNQIANHRAICDTIANHQIALHHSTSNDVNDIDALSGGRHGRSGGRHGRGDGDAHEACQTWRLSHAF